MKGDTNNNKELWIVSKKGEHLNWLFVIFWLQKWKNMLLDNKYHRHFLSKINIGFMKYWAICPLLNFWTKISSKKCDTLTKVKKINMKNYKFEIQARNEWDLIRKKGKVVEFYHTETVCLHQDTEQRLQLLICAE